MCYGDIYYDLSAFGPQDKIEPPIKSKNQKRRERLIECQPDCAKCGKSLSIETCHLKRLLSADLASSNKVLICSTCCLELAKSSLGKKKKKNRRNRGACRRGYRRKLHEADPHCHYCRCYLIFGESTLDHVIPRSKGGTNADENLVLACHNCNSKKGNKILETSSLQLKAS